MWSAGIGIQCLGQPVGEGDGPPVRRSVHGVDGVGDEEPFAELEVVRREGQEGVEEFGRLQHAGGGVRVWGVGLFDGNEVGDCRGEQRREGVVELGVDDGPEGCQVHGRRLENERSEDHVDLRTRGG